MDAMAEIRATFFEECAEQLTELDAALGILASRTGDAETVGVAYRAVHSIKGGAASFQFNDLAAFAKIFEALLGELRAQRAEATPTLLALLHRSAGALASLVAAAEEITPLIEELRKAVALTDPAAAEATPEMLEAGKDGVFDSSAFGFIPIAVDLSDLVHADAGRWRVAFAPRPALYANANESARLIREMLALGEGNVTCHAAEVPLLPTLDAEAACLSWTVELTSDAGEAAIREIFEFAEFDCDLTIERLEDNPASEDDGSDIAALIARVKAEAAVDAHP